MNIEIVSGIRQERTHVRTFAFVYKVRLFESIYMHVLVHNLKSSPEMIVNLPEGVYIDNPLFNELRWILIKRFKEDTNTT